MRVSRRHCYDIACSSTYQRTNVPYVSIQILNSTIATMPFIATTSTPPHIWRTCRMLQHGDCGECISISISISIKEKGGQLFRLVERERYMYTREKYQYLKMYLCLTCTYHGQRTENRNKQAHKSEPGGRNDVTNISSE